VNNLTYQEVLFGPQIPTEAFEVIVGPVAIHPPFGPATIDLAEDYGLITPEERATYEAMSRDDKDEFIRQLVDEKLLAPLGYDPIGLAGSGIKATLLQGGYVDAHTYGWTEFEISQRTQVLTVTNYGIDPYTEAELEANPNDIITRTPTIVSRFVVTPKKATGWISVTATTDVASIYPGETATFTLSVTASEGFTAPVTLTLQGAPSGTTVLFDHNPVTPPGTSQLYITTTTSTAPGTSHCGLGGAQFHPEHLPHNPYCKAQPCGLLYYGCRRGKRFQPAGQPDSRRITHRCRCRLECQSGHTRQFFDTDSLHPQQPAVWSPPAASRRYRRYASGR
jgi:hypothetical protein